MKTKLIAIIIGLAWIAKVIAGSTGTLTATFTESFVGLNGDAFIVNTGVLPLPFNGTNHTGNVITITNGGWTQITFPNVSQPGALFGKSLTPTNILGNILLSVNTSNIDVLATIPPGWPFFIPFTNSTLWASVSGASNQVLQFYVTPQ